MLRRHPFLGLSLEPAPPRVVCERTDSALGDGCVQIHVRAIESLGGVVKVSHGERCTALEIRNPGP
jgi:hypothetical protein